MTNWTANVVVEHVNVYGGVDRTNLHLVFFDYKSGGVYKNGEYASHEFYCTRDRSKEDDAALEEAKARLRRTLLGR